MQDYYDPTENDPADGLPFDTDEKNINKAPQLYGHKFYVRLFAESENLLGAAKGLVAIVDGLIEDGYSGLFRKEGIQIDSFTTQPLRRVIARIEKGAGNV